MRLNRKKKVNVIITIITEYAWICLNWQGSKYASGPKHTKILNMANRVFTLSKWNTLQWHQYCNKVLFVMWTHLKTPFLLKIRTASKHSLFSLPYSKKLTRNDFNAKVINAKEINAVEELLLYFFDEINAVSTSGFLII